jgi:hypothetical protein
VKHSLPHWFWCYSAKTLECPVVSSTETPADVQQAAGCLCFSTKWFRILKTPEFPFHPLEASPLSTNVSLYRGLLGARIGEKHIKPEMVQFNQPPEHQF